MIKKLLIIILLVIIFLLFFSGVKSENEKIIIRLQKGNKTIYINDLPHQMDVAPIEIPPGRITVPVRFVSEGLGARVDWLNEIETVIITMDSIPYLKSQIINLTNQLSNKNNEINQLKNQIKEKFFNNEIHLIESKHTGRGNLPSEGDIKDGLIKMILFTNLENLKIDERNFKPVSILKLTTNKEFNEDDLNGKQKLLLNKLKKDARINKFRIKINENFII